MAEHEGAGVNEDAPARISIYRHSGVIRITHWITALCLFILLMSGLQVFNAHSSLYWGSISHFDAPALRMQAERTPQGPQGATTVFGKDFNTTGVLGVSAGENGRPVARGFPAWATLPSYQDLATGRRWHFFFAWLFVVNGLVYLGYSLIGGHAWRDLVPTRAQLRHIGGSIVDHLLFRFPKGDEARHYNVLQRLTYLAVVFVLLPVMVLAGLTLSPAIDAAFPWLLDLFGGRQSARTIHFIGALLIVLFVLIHLFEVLVSGVWNNVRSMITGRYTIEKEEPSGEDS